METNKENGLDIGTIDLEETETGEHDDMMTIEERYLALSEEDQQEADEFYEYISYNRTFYLAFLLLTGLVGGHRYYLGDYKYAVGMTLTLGGLGVWFLIDVYFSYKRLEKKNNYIRHAGIQKIEKRNKEQAEREALEMELMQEA